MTRALPALAAGLALGLAAGLTPAFAEKGCADTNKDGSINSIDAARILQFTAGLYDPGLYYLFSWDADDDGEVTSIDAAVVLQYDAGLIDEVPVCAPPAPTPTPPTI